MCFGRWNHRKLTSAAVPIDQSPAAHAGGVVSLLCVVAGTYYAAGTYYGWDKDTPIYAMWA
jgi:hypothetical protein